MMKYEAGFIGAGNMGGALASAAARQVTGEEVAVTELELSRIDAIRRQLPILSARRTDLYEVR